MGLGGCYTCIKYLMFTFNLLFWILGCTLLGVGIWVRVDPNFNEYMQVADSNSLYAGSYLLIAVGAVIMILGFLGCCGAIKESQCMLATFFVFLFIIFAVLLAAGIWAATNKSQLTEEVTKSLKASIAKAKGGDKEMMTNMKALQKRYECCGANSILDWGIGFADSGCNPLQTTTGCVPKIQSMLEGNLLIITGVGIGIAVVMLFGMIFSMMLCCAIRDTKG